MGRPSGGALGAVDSHSARIRRAVAMLRRGIFMAQPVGVDALADAARDERLPCLSTAHFPRR